MGQLRRRADDGAGVVDGAAPEEVDEVARQAVAEHGCACVAPGEVVADLEGEGWDGAGGEGGRCARGGGEEGREEGGGELHFDGVVDGLVWMLESRNRR